MKLVLHFLILFFWTSVVLPALAQWETIYSGTPSNQFDIPYIYMLSPVDSNVLWAVLGRGYDDFSTNKFLRIKNAGASWYEGSIPNDGSNYTINIFGVDSLTAWAIRGTLFPEENSFVYKTVDGGENWTEVSLPFNNDTTIAVALHFFDSLDGVVYGEVHDGTDWHVEVYVTQDGGANWEIANTPYLAGERIFIWHGNNNYAVQGDTMWFGTSLSRVFRSTDRGENWEAFTVPTYHTRTLESIAFHDAKNGIVATALSDSLGGTLAYNEALKTEDGGETWTHIPIPKDIDNDPRLVGITAVPGSNQVYMMYGYWQSNFEYKQMVSLDQGMTWYYVEGDEAKTRCLQFISPIHGWAGGFDYTPGQTNIVEKIYRWSGSPLTGEVINHSNEWNRLQANLKVGPNPATDRIQFQIQETQQEDYRAEIFSMEGRILFSESIRSNVAKSISIKDWPSGSFILKVTGDQGSTARVVFKK